MCRVCPACFSCLSSDCFRLRVQGARGMMLCPSSLVSHSLSASSGKPSEPAGSVQRFMR